MVEHISSNSVVVLNDGLESDHAADVVVVGTGIAGCSTALNCLEHGLSVVMFEK
jgi:glycerol-3-phosphate dehydrogenase